MKPTSPCIGGKVTFPVTDYCFHSGMGKWRGYSSPDNEDNEARIRRNFHRLSREFLIEAGRERFKEMAVFALIVLTSGWAVTYMAVTVVTLLLKGRPLH